MKFGIAAKVDELGVINMHLECFVVSGDSPDGELHTGDHVVVDWSRRPEVGYWGAVRDGDHAVRFAPYQGNDEMGRIVNPSRLLEAQRSGAPS